MNNSNVAHAWANQTRESAKGSNFYFEGRSIYSYGAHFEIARIMKKSDGSSDSGLILLTTRAYSNTTSGHTYKTRGAIDESVYRVLTVPRVDIRPQTQLEHVNIEAHDENVRYFLDEHERRRMAVIRARLAIDHKADLLNELRDTARVYLDFFKVKSKDARKLRAVLLCTPFTDAERTKIEAARDRARFWQAQMDEAERRREREAAAKAAEALPAWRRGENVCVLYLLDVALRVSADGKRVETSHGAAVDLRAAHALYRSAHGKSSAPMPKEIDGFPIKEAVYGQAWSIGCHVIPWSEVEALAVGLKW